MNAIAELNDLSDRSLLIVEDDKPFLERLSRAMETRGFAVTSCDTVSDGLAQINTAAPAFAVVDQLVMPHPLAGGALETRQIAAARSRSTNAPSTSLPSTSRARRSICAPGGSGKR